MLIKKKKKSHEVLSYKLLTSLLWRLRLIRSNQFINLEILINSLKATNIKIGSITNEWHNDPNIFIFLVKNSKHRNRLKYQSILFILINKCLSGLLIEGTENPWIRTIKVWHTLFECKDAKCNKGRSLWCKMCIQRVWIAKYILGYSLGFRIIKCNFTKFIRHKMWVNFKNNFIFLVLIFILLFWSLGGHRSCNGSFRDRRC